MSEFTPVCKVSDLGGADKMVVEVDDRIVALFRVGGELSALDDVCTHDGGTLADGQLEGHTIACPRHGAKSSPYADRWQTRCQRAAPAAASGFGHAVRRPATRSTPTTVRDIPNDTSNSPSLAPPLCGLC